MATYVDRIREVVSAEIDDYFKDDTILYYANKAKNIITSYAIQQERRSGETIRVIDELRRQDNSSVNGLTFTSESDYFYVEVDFPTTDQINSFNYLSYNGTPLKEITQKEIQDLKYGNLCPSDDEAYFLVTNGKFRVYTSTDDSTTNNNLTVYYITFPSEIQLSDETLDDMPDRIENALIYKAASLMILQESVDDPQGASVSERFLQVYNEELQSNLY